MEKDDLGIKIKTKEEKFWIEIKESTEKEMENLERLIKFNKFILDNVTAELNKISTDNTNSTDNNSSMGGGES